MLTLRLTLYTETAWIELGIDAVHRFCTTVMGTEEFDAVQTITEEFINRVQKMPVAEFGFTADFKQKMLNNLQENKEKKLLITDHFMNEAAYMNVVKLLNEGKTLRESYNTVFPPLQELETV